MVDAFAHFHATAAGRATCWMQQTNNRYTNKGGRIDYTLIDEEFFHTFCANAPGADAPLDCGEVLEGERRGGKGALASSFPASGSNVNAPHPDSPDAASSACTLMGNFQAVPMTGGGLSDSPQWCYDHHWRRPPSTGLVYTPPQYSDHIAINLLFLQRAFDAAHSYIGANGGCNYKFDAKTRRAQPHAAQRSISSFFGATSHEGGYKKRPSSSLHATASSSKPSKSANKGSIQSFFGKK